MQGAHSQEGKRSCTDGGALVRMEGGEGDEQSGSSPTGQRQAFRNRRVVQPWGGALREGQFGERRLGSG